MHVLRFEEPRVLALRISGVLDQSNCSELKDEIQRAIQRAGTRRVQADIGDLVVADESAADLICSLPPLGIQLSVTTGEVVSLLDQAAKDNCRVECNAIQRALFWLAHASRSAPRGIRGRVCSLLTRMLPSNVLRYLRTSNICNS